MKKKRGSVILAVLVFLVGFSLMLYPTVSEYWNSFRQTQVISDYEHAVEQLDEETYEEIWKAAKEYNEQLRYKDNRWAWTDEESEHYNSLLNIKNNGVMATIEIPKINCRLPIYHGTEEAVLQVAIGHLEGTSLPVGGEGTHCVVSGHRGLPSAKLFTELDKMEMGDIFKIHVLNETLTYEVDQILVIEPDQTEALEIIEGEDYCTLMTCTPYGVNSHRLLVRGHRISTLEVGE